MSNELRHGTWWDRMRGVPLEQAMQGRFTRLFPEQPDAPYDEDDLHKLAAAMTADPDIPPTPETEQDAEENTGIPALYTYFGQFIDHDLTLDPTSSLREKLTDQQLHDLEDFRTPRFDLDCLYGRGPDDQPYLYQPDGIHLQLGNPMSGNDRDSHAVDVPRGPNGRALIGDPRNDENRIVAQLQATMLRFHNAVADLMPDTGFAAVRDQVRWHYQWVVVNDFLPTIINQATIQSLFPHLASGKSVIEDQPRPQLPGAEHGLNLMPVEFSVAAYRFGHSMIRPIYRLNESLSRRQIFSTSTDPAGDLGGMRPIPSDWAIDWQFFLDIGDGAMSQPPEPNDPIRRAPQHSYKIDTSLVNPLGLLPAVIAAHPSSLAERNLLRGLTFALPSGQQVAEHLGETPLADAHIRIGKATSVKKEQGRPITAISRHFAGHAPLWTYVLAEAWDTSWAAVAKPDNSTPIRLGPVGGRLVGGTFAALLLGDRTSLLASPNFTPLAALTQSDGTFGLAQLINAALGRKS
jgi:hypothetical protein